jgi:hypothetical protein
LGFGNIIIWPLSADAPFAPYIGAGGGVAAFQGNVSVGDLSFNSSGRKTEAAAAVIAGIDFGGPGPFRIGARYADAELAVQPPASPARDVGDANRRSPPDVASPLWQSCVRGWRVDLDQLAQRRSRLFGWRNSYFEKR